MTRIRVPIAWSMYSIGCCSLIRAMPIKHVLIAREIEILSARRRHNSTVGPKAIGCTVRAGAITCRMSAGQGADAKICMRGFGGRGYYHMV